MNLRRTVQLCLVLGLSLVATGCFSPVQPDADPDPVGSGEIPEGTVPVTFTIDDSANGVYEAGDGLAWKGSFAYDADTRVLTYDGVWQGPYPQLYDDGTHGDETADDHVWTVTVYAELPDSGELTHEYGAIRFSVDGGDGEWIWIGTNGSFAVTAGDTTPIEADGLVVPAFGTIDFTVTLDTTSLASTFARSDPESVEIKSSAWGWTLKPLHDDGTHGDAAASDDVHTVRFSLDQGRLEGLLELDDEVLFMIVLDGVEYRDGDALDGGVTALTDWETPGEFVEESVDVEPSTGNLRLVVGDEAPG